MTIRFARDPDSSVIHNLANLIWNTTYKEILSPDQISFMLKKMYSEEAIMDQLAKGITFLILEDEGRPVGFASYSSNNNPDDATVKIHKLYILPSMQGKGGGKALIRFIEKEAVLKGAKLLELNVNRNNPALFFYKKYGFKILKEVNIPYYHYVLNDYMMQLSLEHQ